MVVRRRLRRLAAAAAALGAAAAAMSVASRQRQPQGVRRRRYRPVYRYRQRTFSLRRLDDATVHHLFRFSKEEIRRLVPLLHLEEICWTADWWMRC